MNTTLSYQQLKANLQAACNQVSIDHTPLVIEQENGKHVVLIAQEDYLSLLEKQWERNASESTLNRIWDNDDDAEYDRL